ncbi:MauE/DoxX family redox-associated membrane protein [Nocardiopsis algeriensis]|uniref:MauE/DoxX family redox-associated membrane protein n=1 Tax=Nocardiopsis algeriensis TaxID=1478215 RepID=UPI003B42A8CD
MLQIVEAAREVQLPLLAVLLLLGAAAKAVSRNTGSGAAVLLPERLRRPAAAGTGLLEGALGVGLLALAGLPGEAARILTAVVFAVSVAVLLLARRRDPEASCGCFGGLSRAPIGWRTLTRAGLLSAAALATFGIASSGWEVVVSPTPVHAAVLGVELLVLGLLSPELREAARRIRHREPCELREVPLNTSVRRLRRSPVWRANEEVMTSEEAQDVWRHGCWRFLRYDGMRDNRPVDVVYAVHVDGPRRADVRAVVVDRESAALLASFGAAAADDLPWPSRGLPDPWVAARRDKERFDADAAAASLRAAREHPSGRGLSGSTDGMESGVRRVGRAGRPAEEPAPVPAETSGAASADPSESAERRLAGPGTGEAVGTDASGDPLVQG